MSKKISGRLIAAIVSTLMEETALVVIVFWGLPWLSIHLPLWGSIVLLVILMVAWGTYTVLTYRIGSRALREKPVVGLPDMVGSKGKVVSPLAPDGLVKIRGELWVAKSASGELNPGREVIVVEQERLKLVVRESNAFGRRD